MRIPDASLRVLAGWSDRFAAGGPIGRRQGGERDSAGAIQTPLYEYRTLLAIADRARTLLGER